MRQRKQVADNVVSIPYPSGDPVRGPINGPVRYQFAVPLITVRDKKGKIIGTVTAPIRNKISA